MTSGTSRPLISGFSLVAGVWSMERMHRGARSAFERRFNRGLVAVDITSAGGGFVDLYCPLCRAQFKDYPGTLAVCFDCAHAQNAYADKGIRMSMDATGEDSTNPERVRDGTHIYNMGLPATDVEYGKRNAYGQRVVSRSRPVANNEIASARRARELAKRANLTPLETQKRALGGRS